MALSRANLIEELHGLLLESRITDHHPSIRDRWDFHHEDIAQLPPTLAVSCSTHITYIETLRSGGWRSEHFTLPTAWKKPEAPPRFDIRRDMAEYIRRVSLSEIFKQASHHIQFLSDEELEGNDESGLPVFLFHYPDQSDDFFYSDPSEAFHPADPVSFLPFFAQMACYSGDEFDLEPSIAAILVSTPGCLLRRQPNVDYLPPFRNPNPKLSVDFALVLDTISRSVDWKLQPSKQWFQSDLTHPILLLGTRRDMSQSIGSALRGLATLVEPHLHAHIVNWHLRLKQTASANAPTPPALPPWLFMLGFLYHGESGSGAITIVAHIPYMTNAGHEPSTRGAYSYLSLVVDHIPLPGLAHHPNASSDNDDNPAVVCNIRAAFALLSLKRHAVRLADAWEGVRWPQSVYNTYADIEREHIGSLGRTRTSSALDSDHNGAGLRGWDEESLTSSQQDEELAAEERAHDDDVIRSDEIVYLWAEKVDFEVSKPPPPEEEEKQDGTKERRGEDEDAMNTLRCEACAGVLEYFPTLSIVLCTEC